MFRFDSIFLGHRFKIRYVGFDFYFLCIRIFDYTSLIFLIVNGNSFLFFIFGYIKFIINF